MKKSSESTEKESTIAIAMNQHWKSPSVFSGDAKQDPSNWLKEYERVAKYNRWDDAMCLANAFFFLDGTAKKWFENNEDNLNSWENFKTEIKKAFGDEQQQTREAEDQLKCRAQRSGESTQSYIQSVLELCQKADPNMKESMKVSHLMKGVAENMYQALLARDVTTTSDFIKWCQYIENMQQQRIGRKTFERLPNVVQIASLDAQTDLIQLIRQIVREEVQCMLQKPIEHPKPVTASMEEIIREEVEKTLAPISNTQWTEVKPRRRTTYIATTRRQSPTVELPQRKTDAWRTADNQPVCFYCGRPGHVTRYCRERKQIFDTYRSNRSMQFAAQSNEPNSFKDYSRYDVTRQERGRSPPGRRSRSPSPYNNHSRSPSPYRSSKGSPSRKNEEN